MINIGLLALWGTFVCVIGFAILVQIWWTQRKRKKRQARGFPVEPALPDQLPNSDGKK